MRARIVRTISALVNQILNSLVKMQNVLPKPINVMERTTVVMVAKNLTVVSKTVWQKWPLGEHLFLNANGYDLMFPLGIF